MSGQLGLGISTTPFLIPQLVTNLYNVSDIKTSYYNTYILLSNLNFMKII